MKKYACIVLSVGTSLLSSTAFGRQSCVLQDRSIPSFDGGSVTTSAKRATWEPSRFTNPRLHDPSNFRYIVHTIDTFGLNHSAEDSYNFMSEIAANPCATMSSSLIDQNNVKTFGTMGFILYVPAENFIFSKSGDMGTPRLTRNSDAGKFHNLMNTFKNEVGSRLKSTDEVLAEMRATNSAYNEVLIQGRVQVGFTVIGVYIMNMERDPQSPRGRLMNQLLEVARSRNLPVVYTNSNF